MTNSLFALVPAYAAIVAVSLAYAKLVVARKQRAVVRCRHR